MTTAEDEHIEGYGDGLDLSTPEPSSNRSYAYRHSFAVGRAERAGKSAGSAATLRLAAEEARRKDADA